MYTEEICCVMKLVTALTDACLDLLKTSHENQSHDNPVKWQE